MAHRAAWAASGPVVGSDASAAVAIFAFQRSPANAAPGASASTSPSPLTYVPIWLQFPSIGSSYAFLS